MTGASPARRVALDILLDLEDSGGYARDALDASPEVRALDRRDAGLAMRLVLGVVASYGCLDDLIDAFSDKPERMNSRVRNALRIAAFELIYLGTEPRAAVSQGVELVRDRARSATGFANAVLRRIAECRDSYLDADDVREQGARGRFAASIVSLARRGGLPEWLTERIVDSIGFDSAEDLAAAEFEPAPVAVQVNPHDNDAVEDLRRIVRGAGNAREGFGEPLANGITVQEGQLPGAVLDVPSARLVGTDLLKRSGVAVCDLNAQVVATAALAEGRCLEVGSGRGTKTFVMTAQARRLGIACSSVALELSRRKTSLNRRRLERAGLAEGVRFVTGDGCDLDQSLRDIDGEAEGRALFASVLVDAPCSGTGTMRRHPEIPWRLLPVDVDEDLPELQLALLTEAAGRVIPGGQLLYATCSVLKEENASVVNAFLASPAGAAFSLEPVSDAPAFRMDVCKGAADYVRAHEDGRGRFQTVPKPDGFDGHFCARMVRRG